MTFGTLAGVALTFVVVFISGFGYGKMYAQKHPKKLSGGSGSYGRLAPVIEHYPSDK